ncbi:MAG: Na/Pi cotransporter family protein [Erysipelotrichales bacterium]|nr:Na/Pi cotransporter family protein [Erysipelotrichales bacterium]
MTLEHVLSLFGGLALFLYGMHMMSEGLEETAGNRMKSILEKLTNNRFLGIATGALITAIIQSSSATTVMVVGFVNSKLMTLQQAIWIIMGANIGTTITGQLVALKVGELAPIMAIIGVTMVTFFKSKKVNNIGEILAGLGILFIGMGMMSDAMYPLRDSEIFIQLITTISNPFLAVLFGALFTALIQSSSASVGILQALANGGLIPLSSSIYIIFGQNIGTCITAFLASLGASRNAKRTTVVHLSFNIIGTALFMIFIQFVPFVDWMTAFTSNPAAQIANTHTLFNITTTLLLLPLGTYLAKFTEIVLPIHEDEFDNDEEVPLKFIDVNNIGSVPIAISSLRKEAVIMLDLAHQNIREAITALHGQDHDYTAIKKREKRLNFINFEMTKYMSKVSVLNMSKLESDICNTYYRSFTDIERIGDHAINLVDYGEEELYKLNKYPVIEEELTQLQNIIEESITLLSNSHPHEIEDVYLTISMNEDRIDELTERFKANQMQRLKAGEVDALDCVVYTEILIDIERVSDHLINLAEDLKNQHISFTEIHPY